MRLTIFHTNDFHGKLTPELSERIRQYREPGSVYFDCGDLIRTGNLGIPTREDPGWALLGHAGCDAAVPGNRESHVLSSAFEAKIQGARQPLLCANLRRKAGGRPLPATLAMERNGVRIGLIGAMVPMVTERMAARMVSDFLWDPPIPAIASAAEELRPRVDLLIALTHLGLAADLELAERVPSLDLILGGHTHKVLEEPARVGTVAVCQAGSHGRFLGRYEWEDSRGLVSARLLPLSSASGASEET